MEPTVESSGSTGSGGIFDDVMTGIFLGVDILGGSTCFLSGGGGKVGC